MATRMIVKRLRKNGRLRGYAVVAETPVAYVPITPYTSARQARRIALQAAGASSWAGLPVVEAAWSPEAYRVSREEVTVLMAGRL